MVITRETRLPRRDSSARPCPRRSRQFAPASRCGSSSDALRTLRVGSWLGRYALRTRWLPRCPEGMLVGMEKEPLPRSAHVIAAATVGSLARRDRDMQRASRPPHFKSARRPPTSPLGTLPPAGAATIDERAADTAAFKSVICVVAGVPTDEAAHHQATTLASPGGTVEVVSAAQLTRTLGDGRRPLRPDRRRWRCRCVRGCGTRSHPDPDRSKVPAGNRGDGHDRRARRRLVRVQRGVAPCRIAGGRPRWDGHAPGSASLRSRAPARNRREPQRPAPRHRGGSARKRGAASA